MKRLSLTLLSLSAGLLFGCGYPAELEGFSPVETWDNSLNISVESEIPGLDREQIARNIETAFRIYDEGNTTLYKMTWYKTMRIRIWDRQVLYCDQWFLGACVHIVKGMQEGDSQGPIINLNNGGELLLHELMHMAETGSNPDHNRWVERGWAGMFGLDAKYRKEVGWLK